jgi:molybdate transport system substrate-binding protein
LKPIRGISSMATRAVLAALADDYERQSCRPVAIESVGGVDASRRIEAGEAFDFVVLASNVIDRLASSGHLKGSRVDLARSGIVVAVKAGASHPDISSEASLRTAALAARSIGYSTGPSGEHVQRLFARWGVADVLAARLVQSPPGVGVGTLIARDDAELGFQQASELLHAQGVEVVGALPDAIQAVTVFSAGICRTSSQPEATAALLAFLVSPAADAAKRHQGMEPVPQQR